MSKDWIYKNPEDVGMNPDKMKELENALKHQKGTIKNIVVVKDDCIVFEKYLQGYQREDIHNVGTVTVNIMSALIGIAIDKGYIEGVHQSISDFFNKDQLTEAARNTTIEDLLTMSVQFSWKIKEPFDRMRRKKNWVEFILSTVAKKKKEKFQFSQSCPHILSAILTKATGISTREFANEYLFKPTGMREVPDYNMKSFSKDEVNGEGVTGWVKDPQGIYTGGWGLTITAEDLARFGCLFLNNGKYNGKQIISEKWVKDSIAQYHEYSGYSWWLKIDDTRLTYMAIGIGGTYLYCIPEFKLAVVIISKMDNNFFDRWGLIEDYILPSIY